MRDTSPLQELTDLLGVLDGPSADEGGLAALMALGDLVHRGIILFRLGPVDHVGILGPDERPVGRNDDDV